MLTTRLGHLPHGAPTSDVIANLVLSPVDEEVERLALNLDLRASRYLDNIDLGGVRTREAIAPVIAALRKLGLAVKHEKTHNAGPRSPHIVTALGVTSTRPSATRRVRNDARLVAYALIAAKNRGDDIFELKRSVRGRIGQVAVTNPGFARRLRRQLLDFGGIRL